MKKKVYNTPMVTITKWEAEDIITTSGGVTVSAAKLAISTEDSGIKSVSYSSIE